MKSIKSKKIVMGLILLLFFISAGSAVYADTVFIVVRLPQDPETGVPEEVVSAFEDGIMEPFFDAYHIVCNSREEAVSETDSKRLENNGIDYFLTVELTFSVMEGEPGILEAKYALHESHVDGSLLSGENSSEEFADPDSSDPGSRYLFQGRSAAVEALSAMTDS